MIVDRSNPPKGYKLSLNIMEEFRVKKHIGWIPYLFLFAVYLGGCQGTGQMHNFDLHALPSSPARSEAFHDDLVKILVQPFQDKRTQQERIGVRTHFWEVGS